jgi:hypothetical protein
MIGVDYGPRNNAMKGSMMMWSETLKTKLIET